MKRIADFLKRLFSSPVKRIPTDDFFREWNLISYEDLYDHFEVEKTANEDAAINYPPAASNEPSNFHNKLVARFNQIVSDRSQEITTHLDLLETRAASALNHINFLNDVKGKFKNKIQEDLEVLQPAITSANDIVLSRKIELNEFKEKNNLTRTATYPESWLWYYFLLFALVVIESFVNGVMFQKGSASGYLGGVSIAVLISLINVVLGYLVGAYWGKLAWSIDQTKKLVGYIGFAVWGVFTISFNLSVGHIRTLFEKASSAQGLDVWTEGFINFLNSPFGLVDFFSWMLVIIGSVFALLALFDGLKVDDEYPGYGNKHRNVLEAEETLQEEVSALKGSLDSYHESYLGQGDEAILDLSQSANDLRSKYDFVSVKIKTEYPTYCDYFSDLFTRLIWDYRNNNSANRTDDAPEYFSVRPSFNWTRNNREEQLNILDEKIENISNKLVLNTEQWAIDRRELDLIKTELLNSMRSYDSIS